MEGGTSSSRGRQRLSRTVFLYFQDMVWDIQYKTVRWSFQESLEPPQVVQVRCSSMLNQGNMYGQVTVRMHTRQVEAPFLPAFRHSQVGHLSLGFWPQLPRTVGSPGSSLPCHYTLPTARSQLCYDRCKHILPHPSWCPLPPSSRPQSKKTNKKNHL